MKSVLHILSFVVLALSVAGCSDKPRAPDVEFLASDLHFRIGGHHLVIPAVAMRGPGHVFDLGASRPEKSLKETLKEKAQDPNNPMPMDKLALLITRYQTTGEHLDSLKICPLLSRKWSQALCTGKEGGLLARLPNKFDLMDSDELSLLSNHWTVGKERRHDQIKDLPRQPGQTEIGCDKASSFCTAIVEVMPRLVAVWTVWSDEKTGSTAEQVARSQGTAIVQFVRRALGPVEDTSLANAY